MKENIENNYEKSIAALKEYINKNQKNPNEKWWNQYAIENYYLSSKTLGYLSGVGFNTVCKNIRKEVNKEKRNNI